MAECQQRSRGVTFFSFHEQCHVKVSFMNSVKETWDSKLSALIHAWCLTPCSVSKHLGKRSVRVYHSSLCPLRKDLLWNIALKFKNEIWSKIAKLLQFTASWVGFSLPWTLTGMVGRNRQAFPRSAQVVAKVFRVRAVGMFWQHTSWFRHIMSVYDNFSLTKDTSSDVMNSLYMWNVPCIHSYFMYCYWSLHSGAPTEPECFAIYFEGFIPQRTIRFEEIHNCVQSCCH